MSRGRTLRLSVLLLIISGLAVGAMTLSSGCKRSGAGGGAANTITILWAQWPPSDQLQKLGDEYEKQTGTAVKVVQKSWSGAFGEATQQEFKTNGQTYDIIVGDSQWIGQGVKGGHYVELTDFIRENNLSNNIAPAAMKYYAEDPKGSGKYWAVPCEGDAMAWCYRKDLFEDPKHKEGFKKFLVSRGQTSQYELEPPKTWDHLLWIARYFKEGSGIPDMAGVTMPTSRQYDTLTMMFQNVFWAFGGDYGSPSQGAKFDSPETIQAMKFFKDLLDTSSTGGRNQDYGAVASSYIAGNAAMCANFLGFFPQIADPEQDKNYADKTGYFNMPQGPKGRAASLGGQGMSINAHISPDRQQRAKDFLKWFSQEETQKEWVKGSGCFTTNTAILKSDEFKNAAPYNPLFDEAFGMVNDFWSIPEFDPMLTVIQQQLAGVFQDNKDPAAAVRAVQAEWERILKDAGYPK